MYPSSSLLMKMEQDAQIRPIGIQSLLTRSVLAGKAAGQADAPALKAAFRAESSRGVVVLDLRGIGALTPSYFGSALLPLWSDARANDTVAPILANLSEHIIDDVKLAAEANSTTMWTVRWENGAVKEPEVFGKLDEFDRMALDVAVAEGRTDAADLFAQDRRIGVTAWSTRLGTLHQKGLLRRRKDGRRMTYAPLWRK